MNQSPKKSLLSMRREDAGLGTALTDDPSLSRLIMSHGLSVREFVIVGLLAERGPTRMKIFANVLFVEPSELTVNMRRLADAGLIVREAANANGNDDAVVRLTTMGQDMSQRMGRGS